MESVILQQIDATHAALRKVEPWTSRSVQVPIEYLKLFFLDKADPPQPHFITLTTMTNSSELDTLATSCDRATFGRANEDVLDESYRKEGELDLS
ncbi:hypothetical protein E1B28_003694 [Marasmius oreades]|uniref:Uncharacterized protein n=1 Tax=Marasmius oreades TaxID=181124 RepID=A0A9P7UX61_9AGAR|nr:uncharacterized protein E1B28_003694 [Marasmius oreades]KAG7096245.1 hypothetical protein E1B28_003694 [Marasmius oreades]